MIILLDCDGVVTDFIGGVCKCLSSRGFPRIPEEFTEHDIDALLSLSERSVISELSRQPGFCASLEWYRSGRTFVRVLKELGEVFAVTAPWRAPTWHGERRQWLSGLLDSDHVIGCPKNAKPLVSGDVLIEDHPGTAAAWLRKNPLGLAIILDRPWNQEKSTTWRSAMRYGNTEHLIRCASYTEAVKAIQTGGGK